MPFALWVSREITRRSKRQIAICWEWNGSGDPRLAIEAARLSLETGGCVKFDLKAYDPTLHLALTGQENTRTLQNFRLIGEKLFRDSNPPVLTATTLLVPGYVDAREVENIACFISRIDPEIPYSLLAFHPDFKMMDLPTTPRDQAEECFKVAKRYLRRVNIGNIHLLM
jgi:pyruvate formate lyase activating enzyme